ncbi:MAG: hypothetical protein WCO52_01600 [bacterium]
MSQRVFSSAVTVVSASLVIAGSLLLTAPAMADSILDLTPSATPTPTPSDIAATPTPTPTATPVALPATGTSPYLPITLLAVFLVSAGVYAVFPRHQG